MTTLQDLGIAYRKAKVDLFYSSHVSLEAIADYEEDLYNHLSNLLNKINNDDESWVTLPEFIGDWTLAPKSVDMSCLKQHREQHDIGLIFSSPTEEWSHICNQINEDNQGLKPNAEFRVMAQCSLDFHVLSTLWMLEVGHIFDAKLGNCAYGNRLRRTQDGQSINLFSLGSFQPYLKPFRNWRDNGIKAMEEALNADKKIVALTADISSFYHELNPDFTLNSEFINDILEIELSNFQAKLHRLFIKALQAWAESTPLKKGLPVGLPASALIANIALIELDRIIKQQLVPLYYGRYVDDILLVMENGADFKSTDEVWEWLFTRFDKKLNWVVDTEGNKQISFHPQYLSNSNILFANTKNKIFILTGESGKTLVNAITHQIQERASEWRAMPRLPDSSEHVSTDLLAATQSNGEAVDNLRKADALTMRRAGFSIKLRDFEAYERDLLPNTWKPHRQAFFRAFIQHIIVLPQFFDLAIYLPRVIRLATACEDFDELHKIILALDQLCKQLKEHCTLSIKACPVDDMPPANELINIWEKQLYTTVHENICAAFPPKLSKKSQSNWQTHMANCLPRFDIGWCLSPKDFQLKQTRLFSFDLAHMPFRFIGLPKEMVAQRGIPKKTSISYLKNTVELLPHSILHGIEQLIEWIHLKDLPNGLLFATRPYNIPELFMLNKSAYKPNQRDVMHAVVLSVRGFGLGERVPCFDEHGVLQIPNARIQHRYGVAVSSWKTEMKSWTAAVMKMPDPDAERYTRLCRLIDGVITEPKHSRYLIMPELALPAHWFLRVAHKLHRRGISLISGVEYLHSIKGKVRNQVWAALSFDGLGFPSMVIYKQDKQRPALHEGLELQQLAKLKLSPRIKWKKPPIIQHGNLRFALMICSELTNIDYRAALRGKVDALFVPEWNQDIETFNALVESAALDIHAYIVQCNDRQYGDSRIRAPAKNSWARDILRVKGGVTDYCVIGEIDIQALRQFQSNYSSPAIPFKPVPDGFKIDISRKVLPVKK